MNIAQSRVETLLIRQGQDMLSRPQRWGYVCLLIAALAMAATLTALLATEQDLPFRAIAAFSVMLAMALTWVSHAGWVLTRKRPLYGRHRLGATRLAIGFSAIYTAGCGAVWLGGGGTSAITALWLGVLMLGSAIILHARTRRLVDMLEQQRRKLSSPSSAA